MFALHVAFLIPQSLYISKLERKRTYIINKYCSIIFPIKLVKGYQFSVC